MDNMGRNALGTYFQLRELIQIFNLFQKGLKVSIKYQEMKLMTKDIFQKSNE